MASIYRPILKTSFFAALTHPTTWLFGLFAALLAYGGGLDIVFRFINQFRAIDTPRLFSVSTLGTIIRRIGETTWADPLGMIAFIGWMLLALILFLVFVAAMTLSFGMLIETMRRIRMGEAITWRAAFSAIYPLRWKLLSLIALDQLLPFLLMGGLVLGTRLLPAHWITTFLLGTAMVVTLIVVFALHLTIIYSACYCVIGGYDFSEALRAGWQRFRGAWLTSLEFAMILFFLNALAAALISLLVIIGIVPFLLLLILFFLLKAAGAFFWAAIITMILAMIFAITLFSAVVVFQFFSWVNLFFDFELHDMTSKLQRWERHVRIWMRTKKTT